MKKMSTTKSVDFRAIMRRHEEKEKDQATTRPTIKTADLRNLGLHIKDGMWKGQRCFIIGGGPSLKGFDFTLLENEKVIGINRAYEKIDPDIIYSSDRRFFQWANEGKFGEAALTKWGSSKAIKMRLYNEGEGGLPGFEGILKIPSFGTHGITHSYTEGLSEGDSSGYAALNLAIVLQADPIYLLGFDMNEEGGWWHDGYPGGPGAQGKISTFSYFFTLAKDDIKKRARVVNLNPDSGLKCFEFETTAFLKKEKENPGVQLQKGSDIYFSGCHGFGDNFYQRPIIKGLAKKHRFVYISTSFPEAYWDINNVKFVKQASYLRTQKKNIEKSKSVWHKPPENIETIAWDSVLPGFHKQTAGGYKRDPDLSNSDIAEKLYPQNFTFRFPLKPEWVKKAEKIRASLNTGKLLCIIRQPTTRKEWNAPARNPKTEYYQLLIDTYGSDYFFVSIADNEKGKEEFQGELTGIDKRFDKGELSITEILGMMKIADMMICDPGFFMVAGIAIRAKTFCMFGGMQDPKYLVSHNMGIMNFDHVYHEPFCGCFEMEHECEKNIPESAIIDRFNAFKTRERWKHRVAIATPAGIGDLSWVLTKLESFKTKNCIDVLELVIHEDTGHDNSADFLKILSFVDKVTSIEAAIPFDFTFHGGKGEPIRENADGRLPCDYIMEFNSYLEEEIRLENILPHYDTHWNYEIRGHRGSTSYATRVKEKLGGKLVLMYTSSKGGNENWSTFDYKEWVELAIILKRKTGCSIALVGKEWDREYTDMVIKHDKYIATQNGTETVIHNMVGETDIHQLLALIKAADAVVAFPSGVGIMGVKFKTPTVMFFPVKGISPNGRFKPGFMYSWVSPDVRKSGKYIPMPYDDRLKPKETWGATPEIIFSKIERFI